MRISGGVNGFEMYLSEVLRLCAWTDPVELPVDAGRDASFSSHRGHFLRGHGLFENHLVWLDRGLDPDPAFDLAPTDPICGFVEPNPAPDLYYACCENQRFCLLRGL